ncbi:MAG: hypothetical protein N3A38_16135 [Planctomycetota bacterium]|nr:hypothetical protein [Planctomycetota bacterium]
MRKNVLARAAANAVILAAGLSMPGPAGAGEDPPAEDKYRYHSFIQDGKLHIFDRKTGRLVRYEGEKDGVATFKAWYMSDDGRPRQGLRPEAHRVEAGGSLPEPKGDSAAGEKSAREKGPGEKSAGADAKKGETPARPEEAAVEGKPARIAEAVTDEMRRASLVELAEYASKLGINSMVRTDGDRIAITVLARNKGDRVIEAMEITVAIPTVDGSGPVRHRIFLAEGMGTERKPPRPGELATIYERIPAPGGGIPGRCEHEVTYIRFGK